MKYIFISQKEEIYVINIFPERDFFQCHVLFPDNITHRINVVDGKLFFNWRPKAKKEFDKVEGLADFINSHLTKIYKMSSFI